MKNPNKKPILYPAFVCVAFLAFYIGLATLKGYGMLTLCLYSVLGLVVNYFIHSVIHELGHYLLGKISGMDCLLFKTDFFQIDNYSNKAKFGFIKCENSGEAVLISKDEKNVLSSLKTACFGGVAFSFLYVMLIVLLGNVIGGEFGFGFFVIGSLSALYIFLLNLSVKEPTNDGYLLFKKYNGVLNNIENLQKIQSLLYQGKNFSEIPSELFSVKDGKESNDLKYCYGLKLMYQGDLQGAKNVFDKILKETEYGYNYALQERFYISLIERDKPNIQKYVETVVGNLDSDDSPSSYRIQALFRLVNGETDWAYLLNGTAIKSAENFKIKGLSDFELTMTERYFK